MLCQASSRLRKLEPANFSGKILIDLTVSQHGKVLILTFSDGSVQYLDSATFTELYQEQLHDNLFALNEIGFAFPDDPTPGEFHRTERNR